jgi:hypothetical protein
MKHLLIFATCSLLTFHVSAALAAPAQVPQTGQYTCYDTAGEIIDCAGTGQDGELRSGVVWPSPRFTDNGDETITDNLTGLIWTKNANPAGFINWQEALDFIKTRNSGSYLGYNDWRLPNSSELESMINKGKADPADWLSTQGFSNVQGINWYYWSSSSYYWGAETSSAWYIFTDGSVSNYNKGNASFVWPVRTGQPGYLDLAKTGQENCYNSAGATIDCADTGQDGELQSGMEWPSPRFKDNGDQTMTDYLTGLIWSKDANIADALSWQDALEFIKARNSSNYLGYNDWRLPNSNELESLVNKGHESPADWLETQGLVNVQPDYYWSSSTYVNDTTKAWFVNISNGYVDGDNKSNVSYLWPVREVKALRDGIFSTAPSRILPNMSDAQRAMMIASGLTAPTPDDLSHGDIAPLNANGTPKGNDEIDFYDVIAILRKIIGL